MAKPHAIEVRIHQTWVTIRIVLEMDRSISASEMACIRLIAPIEFELRWEYRAQAKNPQDGMHFNHRGVTNLRFRTQKGIVQPEMTGDYYTLSNRNTNGTLFLKRV